MQFCRKTMLTAVYWNVNRLQGFLDEVCFELLLCLSLSLFSNKPRLKSVHLRLQQSDGPHFQKPLSIQPPWRRTCRRPPPVPRRNRPTYLKLPEKKNCAQASDYTASRPVTQWPRRHRLPWRLCHYAPRRTRGG